MPLHAREMVVCSFVRGARTILRMSLKQRYCVSVLWSSVPTGIEKLLVA